MRDDGDSYYSGGRVAREKLIHSCMSLGIELASLGDWDGIKGGV